MLERPCKAEELMVDRIIFNVFNDLDYGIYKRLLENNGVNID